MPYNGGISGASEGLAMREPLGEIPAVHLRAAVETKKKFLHA